MISTSIFKFWQKDVYKRQDHDGIVYLLTNAKGKETAIDAADLKKWVDSYRKGAKEIPITYQRLK